MKPESFYKIPAFEKALNRVIGLVFYYRLPLVLISVVVLIIATTKAFGLSALEYKFLNASATLTGGSIIIGIFYSIINYEHNIIKFKHDIKTAKGLLTFNTASKVHETVMIEHFKKIKIFYLQHKSILSENKWNDFHLKLEGDQLTRTSFISIFNFLECVSIGVKQEMMDEDFVKDFFQTIFLEYNRYYGTYIDYLRREFNTGRIYTNFTEMADKWAKC